MKITRTRMSHDYGVIAIGKKLFQHRISPPVFESAPSIVRIFEFIRKFL